MLKVLFLILVVMSSFTFAQNPAEIKAEKVNELVNTTTEHLESVIDVFYQNYLQNNSVAKGVIVNYGEEREIVRNEKIIKNLFSKRDYGLSEFTLINGGFLDEIKTEIWLVPDGAELPKPQAFKFDDLWNCRKANGNTGLIDLLKCEEVCLILRFT